LIFFKPLFYWSCINIDFSHDIEQEINIICQRLKKPLSLAKAHGLGVFSNKTWLCNYVQKRRPFRDMLIKPAYWWASAFHLEDLSLITSLSQGKDFKSGKLNLFCLILNIKRELVVIKMIILLVVPTRYMLWHNTTSLMKGLALFFCSHWARHETECLYIWVLLVRYNLANKWANSNTDWKNKQTCFYCRPFKPRTPPSLNLWFYKTYSEVFK